MIGAVTLRPRARLDLLEQFVYLGSTEALTWLTPLRGCRRIMRLARQTTAERIALRIRNQGAGWIAACAREGIRKLPAFLCAGRLRN